MLLLNLAETLMQIVIFFCLISVVVTFYYTGELLSREFLIVLAGLVSSIVFLVILYLYPSLYTEPSLEVPYLGISAIFLIGMIIGFVLPSYALYLLYRWLIKVQRIVTYMDRAKDRLKILNQRIDETQSNINNVNENISTLNTNINDVKEKIRLIRIGEW